jgi:hypothetical protein
VVVVVVLLWMLYSVEWRSYVFWAA